MAKNKQQESNGDPLQEINKKLNTIIQSLATQDKRIESLEKLFQEQIEIGKELNTLKMENKKQAETIKVLQGEVRRSAMNKNLKKIEIAGLPRSDNESLCQIVCNAANAVLIKLDSGDIVDIYRRKDSPRGPGSIIAKLKTVQLRNNILKAAKGKRLSSGDLGHTGQSKRIFINVPLIPETKRVLYQAKQAQIVKGWNRVWVYGAEVYICIEEKGNPIKVQSLEDIDTLIR